MQEEKHKRIKYKIQI